MNKKLKHYNMIGYRENFKDMKEYSSLFLLTKIYMNYLNTYNDRFNILNNDSEYNLESRNDNLNEILNLQSYSFEECCRKRTDEIIDIAESLNKDIYVSWSGGVDSTCIVSSFLMNERLDKSRFHLIHSSDSIEEYPYFYELMHKNNIQCHNVNQNVWLLRTIPNENIVVNGNCGDQLDGSNLHTKIYKHIDYYDNWKDSVSKILVDYNLERFFNDIENYAKLFGITLNYFGEFSWLFNFSIKWNFVASYMKNLHVVPNMSFPFFDTNYFSKYGLIKYNYFKERKQINNYSYKQDWKKIIRKYTKDDDYFLHKGKEGRFLNGMNADFGFNIIDTEGYHLYNCKNENEIKNIILPYIKEEYREYYTITKMERN